MKVVVRGSRYDVYSGEDVSTFDELPVGTYYAEKYLETPYLKKTKNAETSERVYGDVHEKALHVLRAFEASNRSLGVILSGEKGLGKSLFGRLLCSEARGHGYPTVMVSGFFTGLPEFLDSIEQECVVFFDEFDKTFDQDIDTPENTPDAQANMLSLFDGTFHGKKLFVVTCNDVNDLSEYFVNRTGRFHYNFRFVYPTEAETRAYLLDNLERRDDVDEITKFSRKTPLSYDSLRSVCFEMNLTGASFHDALDVLNVLNFQKHGYDLKLYFSRDGQDCVRLGYDEFDVLVNGNTSVDFLDVTRYVPVTFNPYYAEYDEATSSFVIDGKDVRVTDRDGNVVVKKLVFKRNENTYKF